jgi:hypothetical protein
MTNEEISVKLTEVDQRSKSNTNRIDKLEQSATALSELTTAIKVMATKQDYIADKVDSLDAKVTEIECKPGRRWDGLVDKLIYAAAGAFIVWLLSGAPGLN